ncbi:MAG TPA: hypothetical protein ENF36_03685 [Desulfobacteraceae bacterium]|nr:hypothetical protein [Desulfobacteraceae bacterium]
MMAIEFEVLNLSVLMRFLTVKDINTPPLHTILTGLVFFGFHIAKALNESIDEVRKEEWRKASGDERKALKGLRWLLFKHSSRRSKKDTRIHILWGVFVNWEIRI